MPQETCFIPVDVSAGSSPPQVRSSGRWKRRKTAKSDTFKCHIYLPDDSDFHHLIPKKATGRELLDYVFWRIDLREKEYFGLKFDNSKGMKVWLDPARKIRKQISKKFLHNSDSSPPCDFYLQVKYFTPDPSSLREEFTRYLFFLHIKRDILEGKLPCSQHHAARLFSYSVQSELGDYDSTKHIPGYTSKFLFMPGQTNDLERAVAEHHKERKGMLQSDAELHFLTYTVLNLEFYGLDSYPVIGHNKENLQLGLAPSGIKIYKDWKMIALFAWGRVLKVAQKRKRLSLVVKSKLGSDGSEEKAIFFELESKILCEVLYDNLVDYLQFYRMRLNVRESRDASRMLAKFRYSTRFMKRDQETCTTSQTIQPPGLRVSTPGLCSNGNNEDMGAVRSVSVNANVEGVFLKSKSVGGYGDRREHPGLPSLATIASETQLPFRAINTSLPPDIPPKYHTFTPSNGVVGGRRSASPKEVVLSGKTPIKECEEEEVKRPASTPFYKTKQIGSFDSTDSHSNETRSSSATPPSPRYTTLQISRFLSHESPIEVRKFNKDKSDAILAPDNTNGDYSIVKKDQLNYNESSEQRFSLMLDPPEDFANSGQIKQTCSDTMLQCLNTNKQNMTEQYLFSYTANNQTKRTKIDSIRPPLPPPPPPKRISSFCQPENNHQYSNSDLSTSESRDGGKQILLLDEIKQRLEQVKIDKPQRPPPIKPKKRFNITQVPPNEIENAANLVITDDTNYIPQTSKPQESVERSSHWIASDGDKNEQRERAKLNLLEDITHELETRNNLSREPQHQYHNLDITEMRNKSRFTPDIDDTPPPTPPALNTSPKHKTQLPTRATHSYTTQGLVLSDPNPKTVNPKGLGKSKSVDIPLELSSGPKENIFVGLERKRSNTPAPLVEQMALYKQQSLTKTLELQQKSMSSFSGDKNNLNTTFDVPNPIQSLPPKPNIQMSYNQQNRSVPTSMYQQNGTNMYNTSFYPTNSLPKQTYQSQNFAYPNSQQKTMGYRENSSTTPTTARKSPSPSLSYPNGANLIQNSQYSMNYNPSHKHGNTAFPSNNVQKSYRYTPPIQNSNRQPQTIRFQPASESSITHWV